MASCVRKHSGGEIYLAAERSEALSLGSSPTIAIAMVFLLLSLLDLRCSDIMRAQALRGRDLSRRGVKRSLSLGSSKKIMKRTYGA